MSQQLSEAPEAAPSENVLPDVERVYALTLTGLPSVLVVDATAIWDAQQDTELAQSIVAKLGLLARQNAMRVIVRGVEPWQARLLEQAISRDLLTVEERAARANGRMALPPHAVAAPSSVAILATTGTAVPGNCTAFFVGTGETPTGAHPTRRTGAAATEHILTLYGTALTQERAGVAFRGISAGEGIPQKATASQGTLSGIVHVVERSASQQSARTMPLPDANALRALAGRLYGQIVPNVLPNGAVVASPAQGKEPGQPNYWFYWQRDGSVTMGHLIEWQRRPPLGLNTAGLGQKTAPYPSFIASLQRHGHLGTSRYTIEGQPITGFGNPQLDGPPLTVLTLARMQPTTEVWERMRRLLDYLLTPEGQGPCMDVWEFNYGRHFNAVFLRWRALRIGASRATALGLADAAARYRAGAEATRASLDTFFDRRQGRLRAFDNTTDPWFAQMSGLDMAMICALLSGRDLDPQTSDSGRDGGEARLGQDLDALTHPAVLATMLALEDAFASLFRVNRDWTAAGNAGFGVGRFPEDANDGVETNGGNPWPLANFWAAQFYYLVAQEVAQCLARSRGRPIALADARQAAFFGRAIGRDEDFSRPVEVAAWRDTLLPAVPARGDGFLNFVLQHLPEDGGVTEQIDRDTGAPRGARDLSWAMSELIATIALREQVSSLVSRSGGA